MEKNPKYLPTYRVPIGDYDYQQSVLHQIFSVRETKPSRSLYSPLHIFVPSGGSCIVMAWCEKLKLDNASTILVLSSY